MRRILLLLLTLFQLQGSAINGKAEFVLQRLKASEPYKAEGGENGQSNDSLADSVAWVKMDLLQNPAWHPALSAPSAGADVSGELPAPFKDESSFAQVTLRYSRGEEEGDPFVRLDLRDVILGWGQMRSDLPALDKAYHFRLRLRARAAEGLPVTVGLREVDLPYQMLWVRQLILDPTWKTFSYDFILGPVPQKLGFYVISNDANKIDLNNLVLEAGDASVDQVKPAKTLSTENLLSVSRFTLGLPPGANLDRDSEEGDDLIVHPDPSVPGPGGDPSLMLKLAAGHASGDPRIIGQPFAVPDFQVPYTASLDVKGDGQIEVRLIENGVRVASRSFPVNPAEPWQRISLTYDKFKPGVPYQLEVAPNGAFWVDDWQVTAGNQVQYLSTNRPEIALASIPASRVYLEDEPARIRYEITGLTTDLSLRAKVVDLYGRQRFFQDVPLENSGASKGEIVFDAFPDRPFGAFRVEAWLVDRAGKLASSYFDLPILRVRKPHHLDDDAPDSPFGVHTVSSRHFLEMAKRVGINWVRLHDADMNYIAWAFLEPKPGDWHFQDDGIRRFRNQHLMLLAELGTAPAWATNLKDIGPHDPYWDRYYQPNNLNDYAHYVQTVVERYHNDITAWDVWNEPWNYAWWGVAYDPAKKGAAAYLTSKEPQKDFVALNRTAFLTARQADPRATVLGMNTTVATPGDTKVRNDGTNWTRGIVAAGGLDFLDVISYHDYTSGACLFPGDAVEAGLHIAMDPIIDARGKLPKPVWMTEGSPISGLSGVGFYHQSLPFPFPENIQLTSDKLCRYVLSNLANGIKKVFLYSMHTNNYLTVDTRDLIIASDDGSPHPSAAAYANMTYWIEGRPFARRVLLKPNEFAYLFGQDGQITTVFAAKPGSKAPITAPALLGMSYYDLYGNPVGSGYSSEALFYGISTGVTLDELAQQLQERFK